MLPPVVLWADPGLMTGIAVYSDGQFRADEFDFMRAGNVIESYAKGWGPSMWLGWESYTIDRRRPQTDAHHAIEMIGVARRYATEHMCRQLAPSQPGQMAVATTAMLKAIGWWVPGKDDAQSAARHMLAWMLREGEVPPRERAILDEMTGRVS